MPERHSKQQRWTPGRLKQWAADIGPGTLCWVSERLAEKAHAEQAYRLCLGLLSLSREYPPSRVEACCQLANREGLVRLKQLKSVLTSGRDQLPASPLSYPELPQEHEDPRPPELPLKRIRPNSQQTLTRLRHLKLTGMADAVQQQLEQASTYEGLPFIERLSLLVEHEQLSREQRKQARLVKQARLKLRPRCKRWTTSLHAT